MFRQRPSASDNSPSYSFVWPLCTAAACIAATFFAVRHTSVETEKRDSLRFEMLADHVYGGFLERIRRLRMLSESLDRIWLKESAAQTAEWHDVVATLGATGNFPGLESTAVMTKRRGRLEILAWKALEPDAMAAPSGPRLEGWRQVAQRVEQTDTPISLSRREDAEAARMGRAVLISPICAKASGGKHETVVAWSVFTIRLSRLLDGLAARLPGDSEPRIRVDVFEQMAEGGEHFAYSNSRDSRPSRFSRSRIFESAGRRWQVRMTSTAAFDAQSDAAVPGRVMAAGLLFSVLLTAIVYFLTSTRTRAMKIARDMTRSLEQSMAEAKNLLAIANRSETGLIILDRFLRVVWVNRIITERMGNSLDELRGKQFGTLLAEPLRGGAIDPGKPILMESDLVNGQGERTRVEFDLQPVSHGASGPEYYLGTARMVDTAGEYRQGLRRAYKALEAVGDRIAIWDHEGRLIYLNPSFEAGFGYRLAECAALGGPFALAVDADLRERLLQWPTLRENETIELGMRCRSGTLHAMRARVDRIVDDFGHTLGRVAVFVDISDHKQLQVELSQARDSALEHAQLKSAFLANMSHEIRTPLNGVTGMVNLLLTTRLDPEQREYAELANVSAASLLNLVNDILDFSKLEAGKMHLEIVEFDLRELAADISAVMSLTAKAKGLDLVSSVSEEVPAAIQGDPTRLRQVLFNLIGNAIKFTARGRVELRASVQGGSLRVEVADTGIGISTEAQTRLFRPFVQADISTTRKYGGTGLGLAIAREMVELMGGRIGCESLPLAGSTFWIELPLDGGTRDAERDMAQAGRG